MRDLNQYKQLHRENAHYGATGLGYLLEIELIIKRIKFSDMIPLRRVLDFGCGKGSLLAALEKASLSIECVGYDPAVPQYEKKPAGVVDMLITTDVLEHVHEDELSGVLDEMLAFKPQIMYHSVCCAPAGRSRLPDGSNTHKTIKGPCWWSEFLNRSFESYNVEMTAFNPPGPVRQNAIFLIKNKNLSS